MSEAPVPPIIYGTAWKESATATLTKLAFQAGFRGFDTANQKKHYREDYAGAALKEIRALGIRRELLFLQSKYTYPQGQDHRLPYDPASDFRTQVHTSFENSLQNFHTDYLDSYLLHGPISSGGMTEADWEVWGAMEELYESGKTKRIGVSNVSMQHLVELCENAHVKPMIVQNRCFAARGWDQDVREHCLEQGIIYQGFSLLTANQHVLFHPQVAAIAGRLGVTLPQVIFSFAVRIGILPLTGTTDPDHMKDDLQIGSVQLSESDLQEIAGLS